MRAIRLASLKHNHYIKSKVYKSLFFSTSSCTIPEWATYDPKSLGETESIYNVKNIVDGQWVNSNDYSKEMIIPNPMDKNKYPIFTIPDTQCTELQPFIDSMNKITKSGVHNPLKVKFILNCKISFY